MFADTASDPPASRVSLSAVAAAGFMSRGVDLLVPAERRGKQVTTILDTRRPRHSNVQHANLLLLLLLPKIQRARVMREGRQVAVGCSLHSTARSELVTAT
jgi:hypothetical protein